MRLRNKNREGNRRWAKKERREVAFSLVSRVRSCRFPLDLVHLGTSLERAHSPDLFMAPMNPCDEKLLTSPRRVDLALCTLRNPIQAYVQDISRTNPRLLFHDLIWPYCL